MKISKKVEYTVIPENIKDLKKILKIKNWDEFEFLENYSYVLESYQEQRFRNILNEILYILTEKLYWAKNNEIEYDIDPYSNSSYINFPIRGFVYITDRSIINKINFKNEEIQEIFKDFLNKIKDLMKENEIVDLSFSINQQQEIEFESLIFSKKEYLRAFLRAQKKSENVYSNLKNFIDNCSYLDLLEYTDKEFIKDEIIEYATDLQNELLAVLEQPLNISNDINEAINNLINAKVKIDLDEEEFQKLKKLQGDENFHKEVLNELTNEIF